MVLRRRATIKPIFSRRNEIWIRLQPHLPMLDLRRLGRSFLAVGGLGTAAFSPSKPWSSKEIIQGMSWNQLQNLIKFHNLYCKIESPQQTSLQDAEKRLNWWQKVDKVLIPVAWLRCTTSIRNEVIINVYLNPANIYYHLLLVVLCSNTYSKQICWILVSQSSNCWSMCEGISERNLPGSQKTVLSDKPTNHNYDISNQLFFVIDKSRLICEFPREIATKLRHWAAQTDMQFMLPPMG